MNKTILLGIPAVIGSILILMFGSSFIYTVPAGQRGILSEFGEVNPQEVDEGLHFKKPWVDVKIADCRDQELTVEQIAVPSQDQLTTTMDISIKWNINPDLAAEAEQLTSGGVDALEKVHLLPKVRSAIRSSGKTVARAESFFDDTTTLAQANYVKEALDTLAPKGIIVQDVLIRDIKLPPQIEQGVIAKKEREQQAEQQKAELERYKTEQEQLVAEAEAKKNAAIEEAEGIKALADANAYEIDALATAEAAGITKKAEALRASPEVTAYQTAINWDGQLPTTLITSGNEKSGLTTLISIGSKNTETSAAAVNN